MCAKRSGNRNEEILRVRVASGHGFQRTVSVLAGNATEQLAIADIRMLVLPTAAVDSRGFVNARLLRSDGDAENPVKLQVRSGKSLLRLTGYDRRGGGVSVPLAECKRIEFSSNRTAAENLKEQPEEKK
jgi:hypothetical protein